MKSNSIFMTLTAAGVCFLAVMGCRKAATAKDTVTLAEMNQAMGFLSVGGRGPTTVDALTNFPPFKGRPFPVPPAGKKFIIDRATGQVAIGDQ